MTLKGHVTRHSTFNSQESRTQPCIFFKEMLWPNQCFLNTQLTELKQEGQSDSQVTNPIGGRGLQWQPHCFSHDKFSLATEAKKY